MLVSVCYVAFKWKCIGRNKTFISIMTKSSVCYSVEYSVGVSDRNFACKWMAFTCPPEFFEMWLVHKYFGSKRSGIILKMYLSPYFTTSLTTIPPPEAITNFSNHTDTS